MTMPGEVKVAAGQSALEYRDSLKHAGTGGCSGHALPWRCDDEELIDTRPAARFHEHSGPGGIVAREI